jgi:hypothetical protein
VEWRCPPYAGHAYTCGTMIVLTAYRLYSDFQ